MANVQKNRKAGGAAHTGAARAKINLFLEVVGKRPDGYHDIDSVFAEIDLADTLTVWKRTDGVIRLEVFAGDPGGGHVDVSEIPVDGRNLVVRAAERLRERSGVGFGLGMRLEKRIPSGAGLGGGSSNAALALRLADACWGTNAREETLREIGAELGSDVPFFFSGGVCVCGGRGERVGPVPGVPSGVGVVVALTGTHSDTAAAYRNLRLPTLGEAFRSDAFLDRKSVV